MREEFVKLRDHLYNMDALVNITRRVGQFKLMEWSNEVMQSKMSELDEASMKTDLMVKMSKNLLASFKKGTGGKNPLA